VAGFEADEVKFCDLTDNELVYCAQQGDMYALEAIISRYRNLVFAKAKPYFLVGADQEDLMQEGMIGLYKAVRDFNEEKFCSFKGFAGVCISRQMITAIKTATRQKHIPLNSYVSLNKVVYDNKNETTLLDVIGTEQPTDPEAIVIGRENLDGIECKISKALSKLELQVLVYYLEGRAYQEIAALVGRDMKAVDNAIQRIKKKMETILKDTRD
jgi:RNA polymerase sporulation-specific sigma factor